ncbi:hypothetical protein GFS60_01306 [Rhodococcus sp. WAY2]|nr:hypothetical protein GFS60_01306 [Rhodococcus sp. WAY2]
MPASTSLCVNRSALRRSLEVACHLEGRTTAIRFDILAFASQCD